MLYIPRNSKIKYDKNVHWIKTYSGNKNACFFWLYKPTYVHTHSYITFKFRHSSQNHILYTNVALYTTLFHRYNFSLKIFRDFRPTSLEKGQEMLRLRIYQVYAWGVPFIICLVAIVLDNLPISPEDSFLRPRFGEQKCWFYGTYKCFAD